MREDRELSFNLIRGKRSKSLLAVVLGLLFLTISLIAIVKEIYLFWLIPPALLLLLLALVSVDRFFLIMIFFIPLSVQLRFIMYQPPADLFIPTELMTFVIMFIMLYKLFTLRDYDFSLLRKPLSILIMFMLAWIVIASIASTMFLVSLKFLLVRIWFILAFYFLAMELFRQSGFLSKTLNAYIFGMVPVIFYNLVRLYAAGLFNQQAAHSTIYPFFNDHTSFGASIAFIIPVIIWFIYSGRTRLIRSLYIIVLLIFIAAIVFSYSRAAWISLILALAFGFLMIIRIPWKITLPSFIILMLALIISWPAISRNMSGISDTSSGNLSEHFRSIANITSDDSNMERINRWKASLRMTEERPLFGWGPGTYQFKYAAYQFSYDKTSISTNFGTGGNAHSEYLGALVEQGIPGALIFILIVVAALFAGLKAWDSLAARKDRQYLSLALLCGLLSYFIHGALNNFLDTDKIASLFWMYIAGLVILSHVPEKAGSGAEPNPAL